MKLVLPVAAGVVGFSVVAIGGGVVVPAIVAMVEACTGAVLVEAAAMLYMQAGRWQQKRHSVLRGKVKGSQAAWSWVCSVLQC